MQVMSLIRVETKRGGIIENGVEIFSKPPEELIPEILVRLPVKSLLRFKGVSKSWLSLISSHQFAKAHLKIATKKNDRLLFGSAAIYPSPMNIYNCSIDSASKVVGTIYSVEDDKNAAYDYAHTDCPFIEADEYRWLVGSCNGLVCLSFSSNDIILWNPTTKKFKMLPCSPTDFEGYTYGYTHGFGYDEVHDDYKVVEYMLRTVEDGVINTQVHIYSLRSNSWKVLSNWPDGDASLCAGHFLNGAIHWSVCRLLKWLIVAQDLAASDVFVELPLPKFDDDVVEVKVQIIQGYLGLCCGYNTYMDVWMMKEYGVGKSWIKVICMPYLVNFRGTDLYQPCPLFFLGDGKILINYGTSLRIYDANNPRSHQFMIMVFEQATTTTYFESLISPNLNEGEGEGEGEKEEGGDV